jgi:hypothetical protein
MSAGVADALITGAGFTVTVTFAVDVHPSTEVPVTVYVVVVAGASETKAPLSDPGIQRYVSAPEAPNVVLSPSQIVAGNAPAVTVGVVFTVTTTMALAVQPFNAVPMTVYVVVASGSASMLAPVVADNPVDGAHEYVSAPLAVNVTGVAPG